MPTPKMIKQLSDHVELRLSNALSCDAVGVYFRVNQLQRLADLALRAANREREIARNLSRQLIDRGGRMRIGVARAFAERYHTTRQAAMRMQQMKLQTAASMQELILAARREKDRDLEMFLIQCTEPTNDKDEGMSENFSFGGSAVEVISPPKVATPLKK